MDLGQAVALDGEVGGGAGRGVGDYVTVESGDACGGWWQIENDSARFVSDSYQIHIRFI